MITDTTFLLDGQLYGVELLDERETSALYAVVLYPNQDMSRTLGVASFEMKTTQGQRFFAPPSEVLEMHATKYAREHGPAVAASVAA